MESTACPAVQPEEVDLLAGAVRTARERSWNITVTDSRSIVRGGASEDGAISTVQVCF